MVQSKIQDQIENDDFFQYFLSEEKTEHGITNKMTFPEQIRKLSEGLDMVNSELQTQIRQNYPRLLSNAISGNRLNTALDTLSSNMERLQSRVENLKRQIYGPYEVLESQIKILERLHNTTHLLRKAEDFLLLHKNLKNTTELEKQATILYEMESLIEDKELGKLKIIQEEKLSAISIKERVLFVADRELNSGLQKNSEESIVKSLQIYCNLHILNDYLKKLSDSYIEDIKHSIKQIFNGVDLQTLQKSKASISSNSAKGQSQGKGPGKVPSLSTSMHFRTKLLVGLEWLFTDELFSYCEQALLLQKCLKRVLSHFLSEDESKDFVSKFSHSLCDVLQECFQEAPVHISQAVKQNLPKILSAFNTLKFKLNNEIELSKNIFSSLEPGYIEKCASNLKVSLNLSEVLTEEVVDSMLKNASNEINVALIDEDLCLSVVDVLCACNQDFWSKIRSYIKLGTDSAQVVGIPNAVQIQNTTFCNLVYHHQVGIDLLIHNLDIQNKNRKAFDKLKLNLLEGKKITTSVLRQLIDSMILAIKIIFLSMDREPSKNTNNINVNTSSLYMREFQEYFSRTWSSHIANFNDKATVSHCARDLATKCIDLFIKNLAMLRDISPKFRQRMKYDCQQLENTLQIIIPDLSVLGKSYRILRSISTLIIQTPEDMIEQTNENTLIPSYIILFLLFGYADQDLLSPHTAAGWSNDKLLQWLDEHETERERLELISGALQKYRTIIRKKNLSQYCPVYPLISTYLEKTFTALHS